MHEEVFPNFYRIEVPLPNNPLRSVNCYVIKTPDRNLVIDTGMDRPECKKTLEAAFKDLDVDLTRTDFFITHLHSDHMGLLSHFAADDATAYFNEPESSMMEEAKKNGGFEENIINFGRTSGFSETELQESLLKHPGIKYQAPVEIEFTTMHEGDRLTIGDYAFECIHTPGHSPGHLCLYDAEKKLMVSGDHVLDEISPNISSWSGEENPLLDFLDSLEKVRGFDVELALPGHRRLIKDFHGRIGQLEHHHKLRLDEALAIVDGVGMTPYDIAGRMSWDIKYDRWEDVGVMQKWFAAGEATAHLAYLQEQNYVQSAKENGVLRFWAR